MEDVFLTSACVKTGGTSPVNTARRVFRQKSSAPFTCFSSPNLMRERSKTESTRRYSTARSQFSGRHLPYGISFGVQRLTLISTPSWKNIEMVLVLTSVPVLSDRPMVYPSHVLLGSSWYRIRITKIAKSSSTKAPGPE